MTWAEIKDLLLPNDPAARTAQLEYLRVVGGIAFAIAATISPWGKRAWAWFCRRLPFRVMWRAHPMYAIVPDPMNCWWSIVSHGGADAMHITFRGKISNMSDKGDLVLFGTQISKPFTDGAVAVRHPTRPEFSSNHPVRSLGVSEVSANYEIVPAMLKEGDTLTLDLVFIDHGGGKLPVRRVRFKGMRRAAPARPVVP